MALSARKTSEARTSSPATLLAVVPVVTSAWNPRDENCSFCE